MRSAPKLILETPTIWNKAVPDGNSYGFGATYRDRAITYLTQADYVNENYLRPWFVDPSTNRFRKPTDPRWAADAGNQSITAWNRQWLSLMGFQYSAEAHDLLGDQPAYLATYKDMVQEFATWFVAPYPSGGGDYYTSSGRNVVKWYYEKPTDQHIENIGHAQHDVVGLYESYASGYTTLTSGQLQPYADATQYVINRGATNAWSGNVDGTGSISESLKSDFIYLSQWNPSLYQMIAQSNIDDNQLNSDEGAKNTGYILYMKHQRYVQETGIHEAEYAQLSGPVVASNFVGYTGSGFADYTNSTGDSIYWNVEAAAAGLYDLGFRYALQSGNRPLQIQVNGQTIIAALSFPATGALNAWTYVSIPSQYLQAGSNVIRATTIGSNGPNIDHLLLSPGQAGDLDGDGDIDGLDWRQYIAWAQVDLAGYSAAEAYRRGDLSGDGVNNLRDMDLFIKAYETAHGNGAFAQMLAAVPEPSAVALSAGAVLMLFAQNRQKIKHLTDQSQVARGASLVCPGEAGRCSFPAGVSRAFSRKILPAPSNRCGLDGGPCGAFSRSQAAVGRAAHLAAALLCRLAIGAPGRPGVVAVEPRQPAAAHVERSLAAAGLADHDEGQADGADLQRRCVLVRNRAKADDFVAWRERRVAAPEDRWKFVDFVQHGHEVPGADVFGSEGLRQLRFVRRLRLSFRFVCNAGHSSMDNCRGEWFIVGQ